MSERESGWYFVQNLPGSKRQCALWEAGRWWILGVGRGLDDSAFFWIGPRLDLTATEPTREKLLEAFAALEILKALPWDYERPWTTSDYNTLRRCVGRPEMEFHSNWKFMPADDGGMKLEVFEDGEPTQPGVTE